MAYDVAPLDTSTRQKLYDQYNALSNQVLSQQDVNDLLARYGAYEDQGLKQAQDAAMMELSQQFSPAFQALRARNYGLYAGGGAQRDYSNLLGQSMTALAGQRMGLASESAARKAAYLRALAQQRVAARQSLAAPLWERMLTAKKKPSFGQQAASFGTQLVGAGIGALAGGPPGAAAGASLAGGWSPDYQAAADQNGMNGPRQPRFGPMPDPGQPIRPYSNYW